MRFDSETRVSRLVCIAPWLRQNFDLSTMSLTRRLHLKGVRSLMRSDPICPHPIIPIVFPVSCCPPFFSHLVFFNLSADWNTFLESPNIKHRVSSETDLWFTPSVQPKVIFLFFNDSRLILSKPTPYFEIIFNRFASLSTFSVIRSVPTMAASAFFKKLNSSGPLCGASLWYGLHYGFST